MGGLIGPHPENLTMDLPCRIVLGAGQRTIEVVGPLLEDEVARRARRILAVLPLGAPTEVPASGLRDEACEERGG